MVALNECGHRPRSCSSPSCSLSHLRHRFFALETLVAEKCAEENLYREWQYAAKSLVLVDENVEDHSRIADLLPPIGVLFPCKASFFVDLLPHRTSPVKGRLSGSALCSSTTNEFDFLSSSCLHDRQISSADDERTLKEERIVLHQRIDELESENRRLKEEKVALERQVLLSNQAKEAEVKRRNKAEKQKEILLENLEEEKARSLKIEEEVRVLKQERYEDFELMNQLSDYVQNLQK